MTFGLRGRITVLSAAVMLAVTAAVDVALVSFYSNGQLAGLDRQLRDDSAAVRRSLRFDANGRLDRYGQPDFAVTTYSGDTGRSYQVWNAAGQPLRRSPALIPVELPAPALDSQQIESFDTIAFAGRRYRVRSWYWPASRHAGIADLIVQTVRPLESYEDERRKLVELLLWLSPLPLVLVGVGSWWLAGRTLSPVHELITTTRRIDAADLSTRLAFRQNDEIGQLTHSFNALLDRLQQSFDALRRFTADASHELRTPLTTMRAQGEVALRRERNPDEYRDVIGSLLEDIDRLEHLVDSLLQLARADAGLMKVNYSDIDVSDNLTRWIAIFHDLAEERGVRLESDIARSVTIHGDTTVLERIFSNLLDNALRYTPAGGVISISLRKTATSAMLMVCDSGPGVPEAERDRIFERFARLQATRHSAQGAGLGLAIARWAVRLHGGRISVTDNLPHGACFRVELPLATGRSDDS